MKRRGAVFFQAASCVAFWLCSVSGSPSIHKRWEPLCQSFTLDGLEGVELLRATYYPAGELVNLTGPLQSLNTSRLPAFCRVTMKVATSQEGSYAETDIWLPDAFNSKFLGLGNGGLAGGIAYTDLGFLGVAKGYAAMSSNCGHNSSASDGSWALNNPNSIIDFAGRAIHLSTVRGKEVVSKYYGQNLSMSYWAGCSTGGRQALKFAQDYPEDYDAILAGAPANWFTHLRFWQAHVAQYVLPVNSTQWISADLWKVVNKEVLRQCDKAIDGVADGVLQDPRLCQFRPEAIACRPGRNTSDCLNPAQVHAVKQIHTDYYESNQTFIFARNEPGTDQFNSAGVLSATGTASTASFFQSFVFNTTTIPDISALTYQDILAVDGQNPGGINAISPNITTFMKRGGKLLQYHGFSDQLISPGMSIWYFNKVDAFYKAYSASQTDDFYRLFMVPGMTHCGGGNGAVYLGSPDQLGGQDVDLSTLPSDATNNLFSALEEWREKGKAPESIVATRYYDNTFAKGVEYTRKLCKFPGVAAFTQGDSSKASNWYCR